jgi:16S rRNA processing protein RimM
MEEMRIVGGFGKPHGLNGEIKLMVEAPFLDDVRRCKALFIVVAGRPMPYFVEWIRGEKDLLAKLEGVDDRDAARVLQGKDALLRAQDLSSPDTLKEDETPAWLGYTVIDREIGLIGAIEDVIELPQQLLALVNYRGKETLIPLHEQLILSIDEQAKRLEMSLPAGLLDL